MSDRCPTCGSDKPEVRGDLPHFDDEGNVTAYEDCRDHFHDQPVVYDSAAMERDLGAIFRFLDPNSVYMNDVRSPAMEAWKRLSYGVHMQSIQLGEAYGALCTMNAQKEVIEAELARLRAVTDEEAREAIRGIQCYDDPEVHPEAAILDVYLATITARMAGLEAVYAAASDPNLPLTYGGEPWDRLAAALVAIEGGQR